MSTQRFISLQLNAQPCASLVSMTGARWAQINPWLCSSFSSHFSHPWQPKSNLTQCYSHRWSSNFSCNANTKVLDLPYMTFSPSWLNLAKDWKYLHGLIVYCDFSGGFSWWWTCLPSYTAFHFPGLFLGILFSLWKKLIIRLAEDHKLHIFGWLMMVEENSSFGCHRDVSWPCKLYLGNLYTGGKVLISLVHTA